MKHSGSVLLALLPVAGLLLASVSGGKTITAFAQVTGSGVPDGSTLQDCANGVNIQIEANGFQVNADGSRTQLTGCTASTKRSGAGFSVGTTSSSCDAAGAHRVQVFTPARVNVKGNFTTGWNTDVNTFTNVSSVVYPNTVRAFAGACSGAVLTGRSFGS